MSRRLSVRLRRWAADPDRLAVAVIVAGLVLTIGSVALGGFVRYGEALVAVLYALAALLPVVGALIAFGALWWVLFAGESDEPPLLEGVDQPPERGGTDARTIRPVARETASTLEYGTSEWYRCRNGAATEKIVDRLRDGTVRALRARRGLERTAAREAVRSGTWTDDRVAAAFLADELRQPPRERRRAAIDPGAAFDRRVRRTLAAVEGIDDEPRSLEPELEQDLEPESSMQSRLERDDGSRRGSTRDSTQHERVPESDESERESMSDEPESESMSDESERGSVPDAERGSNPKPAEVDR